MLRTAVRMIDGFNRAVGKAVSYLMILVVLIVLYEVSMRYLFQRPTVWASEAMVFTCGIVYVLGAAWTLQNNRHVKIDMVWEKLSPRMRRIVDSCTFCFFALYMLLMLWEGSRFALESLQITETTGTPWDPPVYPIKIAFVAGLFMLFLQGVSKLVKDIHFILTGDEW